MLMFLFFWGSTYGPLGFVLFFEVQTSDQLEMGLELPDCCGSNWGRHLKLRII